MDINHLCPGCMREWAGEGPCPHCGFDRKKYEQNSRCLPLDTILAGKYLVGRVLGQGGFGITYMGFDLNMETRIAIKEYFPVELVSRDSTLTGDRVLSLGGDKSVVYQKGIQKYVEEAQNVSRFADLPGIVPVKDFFYENETAYIVMEYIDGKSLKDYLIEKGKLSEEESLRIMRPILDALTKVHEAGIVHRDISPDNIMLTFDDAGAVSDVRLIDFGAARMPEKNDEKSLTIILKHGYAPEEQYRTHGEQGPWTDVYALCATLYKMLTGETPVPAMDRLFQDSLKSFSELGCRVSPGTSAAILKGLAVKKENRIQSIQELIGALYEGQKVRSAAKNSRKGPLIAIACVCLVAVVGIGVMLLRGGAGNSASSAGSGSADLSAPGISDGGSSQSSGSAPGAAGEQVVEVGAQGEEIGEPIVEYHPWSSISVGEWEKHILFCLPDGTVQARGSNSDGQCRVEVWHDVVAVAAGYNHSLGLRSDGRVLAVGDNASGQCDVGNWSDVVAIAAGSQCSYGLRQDGTVLMAGRISEENASEIASWTDIAVIATCWSDLVGIDRDGTSHYSGSCKGKQPITGWTDVVAVYPYNDKALYALKADGTFLWSDIDTYEDNYLYEEHQTAQTWTGLQQIAGTSRRCLAVGTDGKVRFVPRKYELSMGEWGIDTWLHYMEEPISQWDHLLAVELIGGTVYGLQEDGTILQYAHNFGNTELEDMKGLEWIQIMDVNDECLLAKTKDGRILTYGGNWLEGLEISLGVSVLYQDVAGIQEFVGMSAILTTDGYLKGEYNSPNWMELGPGLKDPVLIDDSFYLALKPDGTVVTWEYVDPDYEASNAEFIAMEREKVQAAKSWEHVVHLVYDSNELYGVLEDGTICSTKDLNPSSNVKKIAVTPNLLLALHTDGTVESLLASQKVISQGMTQTESWSGIQDIAMGDSHVVGLREDGTVVATGSNHSGQCDVEDWTDIVFITAGKSCTLGITSSGELRMAGSLN